MPTTAKRGRAAPAGSGCRLATVWAVNAPAPTQGLRGRTAIAGVGETTYYKRGQSTDPEFVLVVKAILAACEDAGINPREIDGFCSYSNDRNTPARLANALGLEELRYSNMQWGGGGGGRCSCRAERRKCSARRIGQRCGRLPGSGPGPVRPLRPRRPPPCRAGRIRLHAPLRRDEPGPDVRDAHHPAHVGARHRPIHHAGGGAGGVSPRAEQPPGGHVRPTAGRRDVRLVPLDHRAVPAVRLLPRERRRCRHDRHLSRAGRRSQRHAGAGAGGPAERRAPLRRLGAQPDRLRHLQLQARGAAPL